ncbi:MAG: hypothetical protein QNJ46_22250 [Leptolyngbyaceae cyanobacterium MO_188.B28]|nr:hypothetical protein [Leptolyngbyaceae cyanobacterium MO_188.B28]
MDNNRKTAEKGAVAVQSTATEKSAAPEKKPMATEKSEIAEASPPQQNGVDTSKQSITGKAKKEIEHIQDPDELIKPLKELLTALEKRQKVVQEMGDYRTVLQSLVSGELLSGEELDRAKQVIQSLGKLVKATLDHQKALATASDIIPLLDKILAVKKAS